MGVPIEVRHMIFEHAANRDVKPKKVLRYWFEKKEVKELIAAHVANNPGGVAPQPRFDEDHEEESDVEPGQEGEDSEDEEGEEEEGENDEEDEDEEEEDEDEEQEDEGEDEEEEQAVADEAGDQEMSDSDTEEVEANTNQGAATEEDDNMGDTEEQSQATDNGQTVPTAAVQNAAGEADDTMEEDENEEAVGGQDDETEPGNAAVDATAPPTVTAQPAQPAPPPPAPVMRAHRKWRYVPKFLRITQCPPPVNLFLVSRQLNNEVKDWFYKVAVLKIDATASWAHNSFFEEALGQIAETAFSPMENIRKAEITFVWDTTWIRAEPSGYAINVFPFFLEQRADFVLKILQQAPDLDQVTIHWHDSAEDDAAKTTMADIIEKFVLNVRAQIKTEEHYIASDAKPHAKSIAGKRRVEFQDIMDSGRMT